MSPACPACQSTDAHCIDDNGARYPRTRVELFECAACTRQFRRRSPA